jgi:hypothetical protein
MKHLGYTSLFLKKISMAKHDILKLSLNVFACSNILNTIEKQEEANSSMAERASASAGSYIYKTGATIVYKV